MFISINDILGFYSGEKCPHKLTGNIGPKNPIPVECQVMRRLFPWSQAFVTTQLCCPNGSPNAAVVNQSTSQPVNEMDTGSTLILKLVECDRIFRKQMMIETNLDLTSWPPYFENITRNPSMPWLCHLIRDMYPIYFQMSQVFSTKKPNSKSHPTFQKKNMPTYQCPKESSGTKQNISINQ